MTILIVLGAWSVIVVVLIRLFRFVHTCDEEMCSLISGMRMRSNGRLVSRVHKRIHKQGRGVKAGHSQPFATGSPGAVNISHL